MKIIHSEVYKGYTIAIGAEFKEGTTVFNHTQVYYDSVILEVKVYKGDKYNVLFRKKETIEKDRKDRKETYDAVKRSTCNLVKERKNEIDKEEREKEMTKGLPESLIQDQVTGTLHKNELVLNKEETERLFQMVERLGSSLSEVIDSYVEFAKKGYQDDDFSNIVRKICEDVIEKREKQSVENLADTIMKKLRNMGR